MPKLLTIKESARWLGVDSETLRAMVDRQEIEVVCNDGYSFIEADALHRALLEYNPSNLVAFEMTAE